MARWIFLGFIAGVVAGLVESIERKRTEARVWREAIRTGQI